MCTLSRVWSCRSLLSPAFHLLRTLGKLTQPAFRQMLGSNPTVGPVASSIVVQYVTDCAIRLGLEFLNITTKQSLEIILPLSIWNRGHSRGFVIYPGLVAYEGVNMVSAFILIPPIRLTPNT